MRTFTSVAELSLKSAHLRGGAWVGRAGVHHLVTLKTCVTLSAFTPVTQFVSDRHETLAVRQNRKHLILIELDFRLTLTRVTHILLADVVENLNKRINYFENKTVLLRDRKRRTARAPHLQKFPKCLSNFLSKTFLSKTFLSKTFLSKTFLTKTFLSKTFCPKLFLGGGGGAGAGVSNTPNALWDRTPRGQTHKVKT